MPKALLKSGERNVRRSHLKGIHIIKTRNANGVRVDYHYAYRGGPRLMSKPGTPAYIREFAGLAPIEAPKVALDTFQTIIDRYVAQKLDSLAPNTRAPYKRYLAQISKEFGTMPLASLSELGVRREFKNWREKMKDTPRTADYAFAVLSRLMAFAVDDSMISVNPCLRIGRLWKGSRRESVWTDGDIAKLFAVASEPIKSAVMFALWTGQRQGDLLALEWSGVAGDVVRLQQSKTGKRVMIPMSSELRALVASLPRSAPTVLTNRLGRKWNMGRFQEALRLAQEKAGVADLTFRDLRGSAVTRLALVGCSIPQIAAITGHSLARASEILEKHYMGGTEELARQAIEKLEAFRAPVKDEPEV